ncbi:MAG: enoyl-CoA hydratase/isomerase family protein [Phycisphaerales bacterium JB038]
MPAVSESSILATGADGIGVLTLNRPAARNALTPEMMQRLAREAERLAAECRVLLLAGAGKVFCAGFDLRSCAEDEGAMEGMLRGLAQATRALRRAPVPVVAAAQGAAVAGGCALLGGCDFVVTDRRAKLGYPALRIGISPAVTAALFRTNVGDARARERQLDTRTIDGAEARRIGLACECCAERAEVLPSARRLAAELAAKPATALRETKAWINELDGSTRDDLIEGGLRASLKLARDGELRQRLERAWGNQAGRRS